MWIRFTPPRQARIQYEGPVSLVNELASWPDAFNRYTRNFQTRQEFDSWRNNIAALLLLPADVNRSLQARAYEVGSGTGAVSGVRC
jgi:hypothetical protein